MLFIAVTLLTTACSPEPAGSESAQVFASRVGAAGSGGVITQAAVVPVDSTAVQTALPSSADAVQLERLGNIDSIDLGPRAGGCTFSVAGQELLIAAAPADRSLPGKATVRIAGELYLLDALPGGLAQVRSGTTFTGEGFSALVTRTGPGQASLTITDAAGTQSLSAGNWVCS